MSWEVKLEYDTYEEARKFFEWDVPNEYNIAWDLLRSHDDPRGTVALFQAYPDGRRETYTFRDIDTLSNQLANGLVDLGIEYGDRVAIVVPQKPAYLLTHMACWKLGAISVPISVLYGTDGLAYRLADCDATAVVADESIVETVETAAEECPSLETIIEVDRDDARSEATIGFDTLIESCDRTFSIADTDADTPATILYTSGTTGDPKGVLHTHDVWIGHYPGFYMQYDRDVEGSVFFAPTEWSWMGMLALIVCPAWHYGRPIVGYPGESFEAQDAFALLEEFGVTDAFFPPTALRMMQDIDAPMEQYELALETITSGGEPVTTDIHEWADRELDGVAINEGYGRTEGTAFIVTCQDWFDVRVGSMGKAVPGHDVAIVDPETGEQKDAGEIGEIAINRGNDPALFTEYWNAPEMTAEARLDGWDLTGDLAERDEDGYFWYKSRSDDLIITSGYRVAPQEVEDAILAHPDVENVGVIGVSDDTRGEIIKAFVECRHEVVPADADDFRAELRDLVRESLAKHQYPREIEFVEELPRTTTGKLRRTKLREQEMSDASSGSDG